jgi:hypothetical protein
MYSLRSGDMAQNALANPDFQDKSLELPVVISGVGKRQREIVECLLVMRISGSSPCI